MPDLWSCSGTLAVGGPWLLGTHAFDGGTWETIQGWFVVVNNGSGCIGAWKYRLMLTHELGHGLGFDHVSDPTALMYYLCCNPMGSTDLECAQYLYPKDVATPTPTPTRPVLTAVFVYLPSAPGAGVGAQFVDTSTGARSWAWSFGDGSTSSVRSPLHTFALPGVYVVTQTVSDGRSSSQASQSVLVRGTTRRHLS
jgi:hypothetical protein